MTASKRRLDRSPARRSCHMDLSLAERDYLLHHGALGHSRHTILHYERTFQTFHRFLEETVRDATTEALSGATMNAFALWLRETPTRGWRGDTHRHEAGIHGVLSDLRAFARWLFAEEKLAAMPNVSVNKLPEVFFPILSDAELDRVFATRELSPATEIGTRNRSMIAFFLDTGVRRSEAAGLTLEQLDLGEGQARIIGKGQKERFVFFAPSTAALLRRWLAIRGEEPGSLFWLSHEGIKMVFNRVRTQAGLAVFHPHQLRHTATTQLLAGGADTHSVRRMLGHSSVLTTERYLSMSASDLKAKHAASIPF